MSSSVPDFVSKCERMATTIPRAQRDAVFAAAMAAKEAFIAAATGAGLRPGVKLRGVGKSGASWGVGFSIKGQQNPTALVAFRGPVHLVNNPTAAHRIAARRKGIHAVPRGDGTFAASVEHPGTRGKHFFGPAKAQVEAQTPAILAGATRRALLDGFGK